MVRAFEVKRLSPSVPHTSSTAARTRPKSAQPGRIAQHHVGQSHGTGGGKVEQRPEERRVGDVPKRGEFLLCASCVLSESCEGDRGEAFGKVAAHGADVDALEEDDAKEGEDGQSAVGVERSADVALGVAGRLAQLDGGWVDESHQCA